MPSAIEAKRYLRFPAARPPLPRWRRVARNLAGIALAGPAMVAGSVLGTPGMDRRRRCVALGLRALGGGHARTAFDLIANPMDSFRYFELDFALDAVRGRTIATYLDVSSPRLVPLMILDDRPALVGDLINPIADDLADTRAMAETLGLAPRARLRPVLLEDGGFAPGSYDLVTCISVLEHIPDDAAAIRQMWDVLRPGGTLVVTVPCAREACEEYTDLDEYRLFEGKDGMVFWQRYYDEAVLAERLWSVTGRPDRMTVFGEVAPGAYDRNVTQKRTDPAYPYWREPIMMGREFRRYPGLGDLPGMGVVGMRFTKPLEGAHG